MPVAPPPTGLPTHIQFNSIAPGANASAGGGGLPKVSGQASALIQGDPDHVFSVISLETLALVHDPDLPPGSPRAWETVLVVNGPGPIALNAGEALSVTVRFVCPPKPTKETYNATAVVTIPNATTPALQLPITATVLPESFHISVTQAPSTYLPDQTQTFTFQFVSTFRHDLSGSFACESPKPAFSSLDPTPQFPTVPALKSLDVTLPVRCAAGTAPGNYTLSFVFRQIGGPTVFGSVTSQVQVIIFIPPPPRPDPRVDHTNAVYVDRSTARICQLTGGGDPEGKPHPNDTTRFALLGTDLGSSFDHIVNNEHRTYFFFGDTHTGAGDQDGDAIAFTTDDQPEPNGLHLQFMMGDNQWRRLVIPGISLGNFEVPTGGFSHNGQIFVFATTGILRTADPPFMENSVLASATDAHNNFDLAYFVSRRNDNVDTPATGGKFINVAPFKINNDDWPGLPDTAARGGQGVLLAGTGSYRRSAPYLAYAPLPAGQTPRKEDWRFLHGFLLWEPGFGPNGPPNWSASENDAIPLFNDPIGEISYCFDAGLKRWLLVYGGCSPAGCGIVLRSAPMPWGPWSNPELIFNSVREGAQGKYMFECGPYGAYVISRYSRWDQAAQQSTIYYTVSNGSCPPGDNTEPRYQVHLMKSTLRLIQR
jgi:hypothetical protein